MSTKDLKEENIPSLPPFKVISDEKLVEDLEPRESKLSKESSLLWLAEDKKGSPRSTYQISPYPLSLPLLLRWLDSSSACESTCCKMFYSNLRCKCYSWLFTQKFLTCILSAQTNFNEDYCKPKSNIYNILDRRFNTRFWIPLISANRNQDGAFHNVLHQSEQGDSEFHYMGSMIIWVAEESV